MDDLEQQKAVADAILLERAKKVLERRKPVDESLAAFQVHIKAEWYLEFQARALRAQAGAGPEDPVSAGDGQTPWQAARNHAEQTGTWPESWGPYHRHFANDAIHRDGGPECDQPGTPRRVYVFDPDYLDEHERAVARWAVESQEAESDG